MAKSVRLLVLSQVIVGSSPTLSAKEGEAVAWSRDWP